MPCIILGNFAIASLGDTCASSASNRLIIFLLRASRGINSVYILSLGSKIVVPCFGIFIKAWNKLSAFGH